MSYKTIENNSISSYNICCDNCGKQLVPTYLNNLDDLEQELWEQDWMSVENNRHYCPDCVKRKEINNKTINYVLPFVADEFHVTDSAGEIVLTVRMRDLRDYANAVKMAETISDFLNKTYSHEKVDS